MDRNKLDSLLDRAYEALEAGDLAGARKGLDRARKLAPADAEVIALDVDLRLEAAVDDEEVGQALEPLETAVADNPDDPMLSATLASYIIDLFEDYEYALPLLEAAVAKLEEQVDGEPNGPGSGRELLVDALQLLAEARGALHDPRGALAAAERAAALDQDGPEAQVTLAIARYDLCDLAGARAAVQRAFELDPESPDAHFALGRLETASGNQRAAEAAFEAAARLDPERFSRPTHVTEDELVRHVEAGLAELPQRVRDFMENVAITVEDLPALDRLTDQDPPLSPGILGLFEGTPPALESTQDSTSLPRQITFFRRNIEIEAASSEEVKEIAVATLIHEVGHFLGLDEDDLDDRGLS